MPPAKEILRVAGAAACMPKGGWYYDVPATPKAIILCPTTCTAVQADVSTKVDLGSGCDTKLAPVE